MFSAVKSNRLYKVCSKSMANFVFSRVTFNQISIFVNIQGFDKVYTYGNSLRHS